MDDQDAVLALESELAAQLEEQVEDLLPVRFKAGRRLLSLDWAGEDVVDQDGNLYTFDVRVLLHRIRR